MAKINAANITKLSAFTLTGSAVMGSTIYGLLRAAGVDADYWVTVGITEVIIHTPVLFAASDSLRRELGEKKPAVIQPLNLGQDNAQKIRFTAFGQTKHIFAHSIPLLSAEREKPMLADTFRVVQDNVDYTIGLGELEGFYWAAWRRQMNGKAPLSRQYFMSHRRPRLDRPRYDAIIHILIMAGFVTDRGERRSGKLRCQPSVALKVLPRLAGHLG